MIIVFVADASGPAQKAAQHPAATSPATNAAAYTSISEILPLISFQGRHHSGTSQHPAAMPCWNIAAPRRHACWNIADPRCHALLEHRSSPPPCPVGTQHTILPLSPPPQTPPRIALCRIAPSSLSVLRYEDTAYWPCFLLIKSRRVRPEIHCGALVPTPDRGINSQSRLKCQLALSALNPSTLIHRKRFAGDILFTQISARKLASFVIGV